MRQRTLIAIILVLLAALGFAVGLLVLQRSRTAASDAAGTVQRAAAPTVYFCPMHPTMTSDRAIDCPICGMRMVPVRGDAAGSSPSPSGRTSGEPRGGLGAGASPGDRDHTGHGEAASSLPEGLSTVRISPARQRLVGLSTTSVRRVSFHRQIRAVARVTFDETRLHHIHAKVSGYVERLATDTGSFLHAGQPLLEIYSPELLSAQEDYLTALRAHRRTAASSLPAVAEAGSALLDSARRRLELLDVSTNEIAELEQSGRALRTITLDAPITGYVLVRSVTHGERVTPEMSLLDIADLSHVWVMASIFEYELPFVHAGQRAVLTLPYLPGQSRKGMVTLVYPTLDPATRTVQLRLQFPNPDLTLKPEMFGEVVIDSDLGQRLGVPDSAVMDTGTRRIAFVRIGEGVYEPREVTVGVRLSDLCEIRSGLKEGDEVVTSANFFLDSESKLGSALAQTPHAHAGADQP